MQTTSPWWHDESVLVLAVIVVPATFLFIVLLVKRMRYTKRSEHPRRARSLNPTPWPPLLTGPVPHSYSERRCWRCGTVLLLLR